MSKIYYKSPEETELNPEGSLPVSKKAATVAWLISPGVITKALKALITLKETCNKDNGSIPAYLNYNGFPYSLCISSNEQVVHGFPGDYVIQEGFNFC